MSVGVEWDNDGKTAIRFIYQDSWTWEEFHSSIQQGLLLMDTVNHSVDHIYDVTEAGSMPSGAIGQFSRLRNQRQHPNIRRRVLVGANRFIRLFSDVIIKIYPDVQNNFFVVATLDEARQRLHELA
jgi:hypothetical protein